MSKKSSKKEYNEYIDYDILADYATSNLMENIKKKEVKRKKKKKSKVDEV